MMMQIEPDNNKGRVFFDLSAKITELGRRLKEEEERFVLLQSKSELVKITAAQEVESYKRECFGLREAVSRLEKDCIVMRDRELRDRDRMVKLLEEINTKEKEFGEKFVEFKVASSRDLECAEERVIFEAQGWKKKYGELESRFAELKAESIRVDEEVGTWKEKYKDLEKQNVGVETVERELKEKLIDLSHANERANEEINEWKVRYEEWKDRELRFIEENSRLAKFEKKEREVKDKLVELGEESKVLSCAVQRAELDVREWKRKYSKLESQTFSLVEGNCRLIEMQENERLLKDKLFELEAANKDVV